MAFITHSQDLRDSIRNETAPAILPVNGIDTSYLHGRCPRLKSLFNEVLRYTSASSSIRTVISPTVIGAKQFHAGARVVCPFRQLHYNEAVYGDDVMTFNPDRFLQNKTLARSSSHRPFGSGTSYCPGRFIARQEVYYVVTLILYRFEVELTRKPGSVGDPTFPVMDEWRPTTGMMSPIPGDDVFLQVRALSG